MIKPCTVCRGPMTVTEAGQTEHPACDPDADTLPNWTPSPWIPPTQRGPCALCGTTIRRYGDGATTLCSTCHPNRKATR